MTTTSTDRFDSIRTASAIKVPVRATTTEPITLSGLQTIDGVALAAGDRVLVRNQVDTTLNGIYTASTGTWIRAKDANSSFEMKDGTTVLVTDGTVYGQRLFLLETADPFVIGTSGQTWTQFQSGGGGTTITLSEYGGVDDGVTDNTDAFNEAVEYLVSLGGGKLIVDQVQGDSYYFNSTMKVEGSFVHVLFETTVLYGPLARFALQGQNKEFPNGEGIDVGRYTLRATSGFGVSPANRLYMSNTPGKGADQLSVGDLIIIRGENDASGQAIQREERYVTAVVTGPGTDLTTNYVDLDADLEETYQTTYPGSAWPSDLTTGTTIATIVGSPLAANAAAGATSVVVNDATDFAVGDYVMLQDKAVAGRYNSTLNQLQQGTNKVHWDMARITNIAGTTITLNTPLYHSYLTADDAFLSIALPVKGCKIENMHVSWTETPATNGKWVIWLFYALDCEVSNITMHTPVGGPGHATHACRIGEGSMRNWVHGVRVERVAASGGGFGYGVTCYKGAKNNIVSNCVFDGTRHAILEFAGASGNLIANNISFNCLNSDFDLHGANELGSMYVGNIARYGPELAAGVSVKSGFRVGNPAHLDGAHEITFIGNLAEGFPEGHYAYDIQPPCRDFVAIGNRATNCHTMWRIAYNARADGVGGAEEALLPTLAISNLLLKDCVMTGGVRHISMDGGPQIAVTDVTVQGSVLHGLTQDANQVRIDDCDQVTFLDYNVVNLADGTSSDVFYFQTVTNLVMDRVYVDGGEKLIRMFDCGAAIFRNFTIKNLTFRTLINDGDGNDNTEFVDFNAIGFKPRHETIGTPSVGIKYRSDKLQRVLQNTSITAGVYGSAVGAPFDAPQIPLDVSDPLITEGKQLFQEDFDLLCPKGKLDVEVSIPAITTSAATEVILSFFLNDTLVAVAVENINAAVTSRSLLVRRTLDPGEDDTNNAQDLEVRIGCSDASTFTLGGFFATAALTMPQLSIREVSG